jgi:predicted ATP-dependent endonuclease of OLD family
MQAQLDAMKTELAAIRASMLSPSNHTSMRWATASRQDINMAVGQWNGNKAREKQKAWMDALAPDVQEKIRKYDILQSTFMQMQMAMNNPGMFGHHPLPPNFARTPPTESEFEAMSNRVEEAKKPIGDILEQRDQMQADYNHEDDTVDQLVAEYVKGQYDLVVDSSFPNKSVLFSSGANVPDITRGVIKLFKEETKNSGHAHQ